MRNFHIRFATTDSDAVYNHSTRKKNGGFDLVVHQLSKGEPIRSYHLVGRADPDGKLTVILFNTNGLKLGEVTTDR